MASRALAALNNQKFGAFHIGQANTPKSTKINRVVAPQPVNKIKNESNIPSSQSLRTAGQLDNKPEGGGGGATKKLVPNKIMCLAIQVLNIQPRFLLIHSTSNS